jgi:hypothetical protein
MSRNLCHTFVTTCHVSRDEPSVEKILHASPALSFDLFFMGSFATWLYKSRECTHQIWYQSRKILCHVTYTDFVREADW